MTLEQIREARPSEEFDGLATPCRRALGLLSKSGPSLLDTSLWCIDDNAYP